MFDSKKEAKRFGELKLLLKAKKIYDLQCHPKFPLFVKNQKVCVYIADFTYRTATGHIIVEDVKSKGTKTSTYRLKNKLMKAIYGIDIYET